MAWHLPRGTPTTALVTALAAPGLAGGIRTERAAHADAGALRAGAGVRPGIALGILTADCLDAAEHIWRVTWPAPVTILEPRSA